MNESNSNTFKIPIKGLSLIVIICIFPIFQIVLLTIFGGFLALLANPIEQLINERWILIGIPIIFVIYGSYLQLITKNDWFFNLGAFQILVSGQMLSLITFDLMKHSNNYLLQWFETALPPVLLIILITVIKSVKK